MKKNIIKLIIGLFATGTVATTSAVITTKVVENKEKKMAEKPNNNTIIYNISEEKNENEIENQIEEETTENEVVENNQSTITTSTNNDNQPMVNSDTKNTSLEGTTQGGVYYMTEEEKSEHQNKLEQYLKEKWEAKTFDEMDEIYKKYYGDSTPQQTQPTVEPSPEAETTEVVE